VVLKKAEGTVRWRDTLHHNLGEISQNSFGFSSCFVVTVGNVLYVGRYCSRAFLYRTRRINPCAPYLDDLQYLCSSLTPVRVLETPYPVL